MNAQNISLYLFFALLLPRLCPPTPLYQFSIGSLCMQQSITLSSVCLTQILSPSLSLTLISSHFPSLSFTYIYPLNQMFSLIQTNTYKTYIFSFPYSPLINLSLSLSLSLSLTLSLSLSHVHARTHLLVAWLLFGLCIELTG